MRNLITRDLLNYFFLIFIIALEFNIQKKRNNKKNFFIRLIPVNTPIYQVFFFFLPNSNYLILFL